MLPLLKHNQGVMSLSMNCDRSKRSIARAIFKFILHIFFVICYIMDHGQRGVVKVYYYMYVFP